MDPSSFLRSRIRTVPDWPEPGVRFRDITPLLLDPCAMRMLVDQFVWRYMQPHRRPDVVAGIDARGFIIGAVLAFELGVGFIPVRKKGKLPFETLSEDYALEYGNAAVEVHVDALQAGQRVLLVDDLIATGGTMLAAQRLLRRLGAGAVEGAAIVDLPDLGGSAVLRAQGLELYTLMSFDAQD